LAITTAQTPSTENTSIVILPYFPTGALTTKIKSTLEQPLFTSEVQNPWTTKPNLFFFFFLNPHLLVQNKIIYGICIIFKLTWRPPKVT